MLGSDLSESSPQVGLLDLNNLADIPQGAAVLAHHRASERIRYPEHGAADIGDGLALGDQLLGGFELADDLVSFVVYTFHSEVPGPVWRDEDSHSP